eukprot:TRINITY_DN10908_c0_g1_i1.p2 TRINITY_DN10908_c0_g1~~TRINITY_DN10908_c0_g1_i1.p2  ORF type:complete len:335 (+),score=116.28 TRINITY_DN10908_c0_g1_i1:678-1682(+)
MADDGMDKISPVGKTHAWVVEHPKEPTYQLLTPADFGLAAVAEEGGVDGGRDPLHNAVAVLRVLRGDAAAPAVLRDMVLIHAAALAVVTGRAKTYVEGMDLMRATIASGAAGRLVDEYARQSTRSAHGAATDILRSIVRRRRVDVAHASAATPEAALRAAPLFGAPTVDLAATLRRGATPITVLAEVKRASPSEGDITAALDVSAVAAQYVAGGAAALSVLTEPVWFRGSLADLEAARGVAEHATDPAARPAILRKDFVFTEYQILEAKAHGADSVLLIAAIEDAMVASGSSLGSLVAFSRGLGMEPLVEVVTEAEVDRAIEVGAKVVGSTTGT